MSIRSVALIENYGIAGLHLQYQYQNLGGCLCMEAAQARPVQDSGGAGGGLQRQGGEADHRILYDTDSTGMTHPEAVSRQLEGPYTYGVGLRQQKNIRGLDLRESDVLQQQAAQANMPEPLCPQ